MAGKSKGPKLKAQHDCCFHIAAISGFNPGPDGRPSWVAQTHLCCHCGQARVRYVGIASDGSDHGPFVGFEPAPNPAPSVMQAGPKLVLPGGRA